MNPPLNQVTLKIPGTTSNLGSGFDTLGLALRLYNRITLMRTTGSDVELTTPIAPEARDGALAMLRETARLFFERTGTAHIGFSIGITGDVPVARGLGSSTTVQLGCLAGLNALAATGLDRQDLFEMVHALEGHPDNAAPAVFGGFTVAGSVGETVRVIQFPMPTTLKFVTVIPDFEVKTQQARNCLPTTYSRADLVHSINRATLITAALAGGEFDKLRDLFDDRVHQPYRALLNPHLSEVVETARRAGALGGWLSGSGSTVICLATGDAQPVFEAAQSLNPMWKVSTLLADNNGYEVLGAVQV
jgi:homoserine kinase